MDLEKEIEGLLDMLDDAKEYHEACKRAARVCPDPMMAHQMELEVENDEQSIRIMEQNLLHMLTHYFRLQRASPKPPP